MNRIISALTDLLKDTTITEYGQEVKTEWIVQKIAETIQALQPPSGQVGEVFPSMEICENCGESVESCRNSKVACCPECAHGWHKGITRDDLITMVARHEDAKTGPEKYDIFEPMWNRIDALQQALRQPVETVEERMTPDEFRILCDGIVESVRQYKPDGSGIAFDMDRKYAVSYMIKALRTQPQAPVVEVRAEELAKYVHLKKWGDTWDEVGPYSKARAIAEARDWIDIIYALLQSKGGR